MKANAFEAALRAEGIDCTVEERDALAVVVPGGDGMPRAGGAVLDAAQRALVLRLGREHGFTHVAVELPPPAARV
ncbi:MAG TPA: hypothetical protein VMM18_00200 [Gemmatimonadaceae bacterium]|nr:hypothetical protein [Gemmatimonadaceae bacterium]